MCRPMQAVLVTKAVAGNNLAVAAAELWAPEVGGGDQHLAQLGV